MLGDNTVRPINLWNRKTTFNQFLKLNSLSIMYTAQWLWIFYVHRAVYNQNSYPPLPQLFWLSFLNC